MKISSYIIVFISFSTLIQGQTKPLDLYSEFQAQKPKYKKIVLKKVNFFSDDDPSDTSFVSVITWSKNRCERISYFDNPFDSRACKETKTVTIYDSRHRNKVVTKFYRCDTLTLTKCRIKTTDSILMFKNNQIVSKSKYNKHDNSWTLTYKSDGSDMKYIYTQDSIKYVTIEYRNDSLMSNLIEYKHNTRLDSSLYYSPADKLIFKDLLRYNKFGDVEYQEKIDYDKQPIDTIRISTTYVYDRNGVWIEQKNIIVYIPSREILSGKEYERGPRIQLFLRQPSY